jgi:S1-C subfamily serine protease
VAGQRVGGAGVDVDAATAALNKLDLLILLIVFGAGLHGLLLGAATQLLSAGGVAVGFVVGAAVAPLAAGLAGDPTVKAILALSSLFGFTLAFGGVGRELGVRAWGRLRRAGVDRVDAGVGALLAAASALLACWLVASMLATAPVRDLAAEAQQSAILRTLNRHLPSAPSVFSRLQRLIDAGGLPQVFAELEPRPAPRLPLPGDPQLRAAVARAGASTVKIVGKACSVTQEGSGFVAGPGIVVTNAHVVAGVRHPVVVDSHGSHDATPILFDPALDLSVLRTGPLGEPVLDLLGTGVPRGTTGVVLGYPGGGPFDAEPAAVLTRLNAIGRDIYGRRLTMRAVYEVESRIRPGNSGGPLVRPDGAVVGVVFARSSLNDDIGYALTSDEVRPKIAATETRSGPVSTGPCTAG